MNNLSSYTCADVNFFETSIFDDNLIVTLNSNIQIPSEVFSKINSDIVTSKIKFINDNQSMYLYPISSCTPNIPYQWTEIEGNVRMFWNFANLDQVYLRPSTKYIKIGLLANHEQHGLNTELLIKILEHRHFFS